MFEDEQDDHSSINNQHHKALKAKAWELFKIVQALETDLPSDEDLQHAIRFMLEDVATINGKVAGAQGDTLYAIKMQNAALIRQAAMDLYVSKHTFEEVGYNHMRYFELLRNTLDEFREIFIDWVASFDQWNYVKDEWGLFNPPGVHARDKHPDEDNPFTNPLDPDTYDN